MGGRNVFLGIKHHDVSHNGEMPDSEILPVRLAKSTYFGSVSDIIQEDRLPLSFLQVIFSHSLHMKTGMKIACPVWNTW